MRVLKSTKIMRNFQLIYVIVLVVLVCSASILFLMTRFTKEEDIDTNYIFYSKEYHDNSEKGFQIGLKRDWIQQTIRDEARIVSAFNKTVMVTLINSAYIPFAFSWLCNTQAMGIHNAILVATTSESARRKLQSVWPDIRVVSLNIKISEEKQDYSTVQYVKTMIQRAELFKTLLDAGHEVMLFEFDYVWFENPLPRLQKMNDVDMLVNPVSNTDKKIINGGLIYLFPTDKTKLLWTELTRKLHELNKEISGYRWNSKVSESTNDQTYLSDLWRSGYAHITTRELSLDKYADGKWYSGSNEERSLWNPIMISNNWIIGNDNKIARAKKFGHWFLKDDGQSCDMKQVNKTIRLTA